MKCPEWSAKLLSGHYETKAHYDKLSEAIAAGTSNKLADAFEAWSAKQGASPPAATVSK